MRTSQNVLGWSIVCGLFFVSLIPALDSERADGVSTIRAPEGVKVIKAHLSTAAMPA